MEKVAQIRVLYVDTDQMGVVNNVVYFRYLENARLEYFRRLDWFTLEAETGVGPILAATQARFRKPLTYPDTISITARVAVKRLALTSAKIRWAGPTRLSVST